MMDGHAMRTVPDKNIPVGRQFSQNRLFPEDFPR